MNSYTVEIHRKLLRQHFGEHLERVVLDYFKSLFRKVDSQSVMVFLSRKGFCLYEILTGCGYIDNRHKVQVISDRYLYKITDWSVCSSKRFYVVDDTISTGRQLNKVCKLLQNNEITDIYPSAVLAWDEFDNSIGLPREVECADVVSENSIHEYTCRVMRLIEALGMAFTMDLPIYCAEMSSGELDSLRAFRDAAGRWGYVRMDNKDEETSFVLSYNRRNAGQNFLFEGIRVTQRSNGNGSFYVRLIPTVVFDRVSWKTALNYLRALFNEISARSGNGLKELKALFDIKHDDSLFVTRLHKILSYVLAVRVSQHFFKEYTGGGIVFDAEFEKYHFPETLASELKILRDTNFADICVGEEALLDEVAPGTEDKCIIDRKTYDDAETAIGASLFQVASNISPEQKDSAIPDKPTISLRDVVMRLHDTVSGAGSAAYAVGLASLRSTLRSASSYIAKIEGEYLLKYAYSGENSYAVVQHLKPYYFGICSFALSVGNIMTVRANLRDITDKFYEEFSDYQKNDGLLMKLTEWIESVCDLQKLTSLWSYLFDLEYPDFCKKAVDDGSRYKDILEWVAQYETRLQVG